MKTKNDPLCLVGVFINNREVSLVQDFSVNISFDGSYVRVSTYVSLASFERQRENRQSRTLTILSLVRSDLVNEWDV